MRRVRHPKGIWNGVTTEKLMKALKRRTHQTSNTDTQIQHNIMSEETSRGPLRGWGTETDDKRMKKDWGVEHLLKTQNHKEICSFTFNQVRSMLKISPKIRVFSFILVITFSFIWPTTDVLCKEAKWKSTSNVNFAAEWEIDGCETISQCSPWISSSYYRS